MKKYIKIAYIFAILGLCAGVYYREFSKALGITSQYTVLGQVHPHLIGLGVFGILLIGLVNRETGADSRQNTNGLRCYIIGTAGMSGFLLIRGTIDVLQRAGSMGALGAGANGAISGLAGLFHITTACGIIMLFHSWKKAAG